MILITGAAGFIGSYLSGFLNRQGHKDIILCDDFKVIGKKSNWQHKSYLELVQRDLLFEYIQKNHADIDVIYHLGARTDTAEKNKEVFDKLNLNFSKKLWDLCVKHQIPLIYASSAATYGNGEYSYSDEHSLIPKLKPLNPYGESKQDFDNWVLSQKNLPPFWAGLKFFNVYGPNEYHKGRMASVIFHAFHQIQQEGKLKLFRSHKDNFADGEQKRDFIYVKDIAEICYFLYKNRLQSGIYNAGSGKARSFLDLANAVFSSMNIKANIEFIDIPADIRDTYQYFTEADMSKLLKNNYPKSFTSLEDGVHEYVNAYLINKTTF
ncbi:MAG: ADP-glyceromanno-heptose 6-epimerase [Chitinophagaceae bacterium]|nr:MAG: ADP-glyceromanno-heptose 6-epimerase [Chitinophagaceae bacterium]